VPLPRAVFLHTGWRSSGTWIWEQFRALPEVVAFYEPLHEQFALVRRSELVKPPAHAARIHGHPESMRPYFEEFEPLFSRTTGRLRYYKIAFAVDEYFAVPERRHRGLARYLQSLLDFATSIGKAPVLKFARSMGRVGWLRQNFSHAVHVAVLRDPWTQWASSWKMYADEENDYFVVMPRMVLASNLADPRVRAAVERMGLALGSPAGRTFGARHKACEAVARGASPEALYRVFLALWTLCAYEAIACAHTCVDIDKLAASSDYRARVQATLAALTGLTPDLTDARTSRHALGPPGTDAGAIDADRCRADALALAQWLLDHPTGGAARAPLAAREDAFEVVRAKLFDRALTPSDGNRLE